MSESQFKFKENSRNNFLYIIKTIGQDNNFGQSLNYFVTKTNYKNHTFQTTEAVAVNPNKLVSPFVDLFWILDYVNIL